LAKHNDELRKWTYRVKKTEHNFVRIGRLETKCQPPAEEIPRNTTPTEQDFAAGWECSDECFFFLILAEFVVISKTVIEITLNILVKNNENNSSIGQYPHFLQITHQIVQSPTEQDSTTGWECFDE
jgi:hypothetical protein